MRLALLTPVERLRLLGQVLEQEVAQVMETEQEVPQEIQLGQALLVHQEQEHLLVLVPEVQRRRQPARQLYQIVERLRLIPDGRRVAMERRIDLLVSLEQAQGRPVHPALDQGHRVSPERRLASQVG